MTKPDKSVRLCCDYRYLNKYTVPDSMPMPILMDYVHKVSIANFITICDAKSGFWQLLIKLEDRWKCTFVTDHGVWQWKKMPFGLKNAPGTFVRLMRFLFHSIRDFSEAYIDDSYTFSSCFNLHMTHLRQFLFVVCDAGLTLNFAKCQFAQSSVPFLGYSVGSGQFVPNPAKVEAIMNMKEPQTKTEVKRALNIFLLYRDHVKNFARIAQPLTDLTGNKTLIQLKLGSKEKNAFVEFLHKISTAPIFACPRFGDLFSLYTDANQFAVGCCLAQLNDSGVEFPVAYASQRLTSTQNAWSTSEKEAYAVISAVTRFRTIILYYH